MSGLVCIDNALSLILFVLTSQLKTPQTNTIFWYTKTTKMYTELTECTKHKIQTYLQEQLDLTLKMNAINETVQSNL